MKSLGSCLLTISSRARSLPLSTHTETEQVAANSPEMPPQTEQRYDSLGALLIFNRCFIDLCTSVSHYQAAAAERTVSSKPVFVTFQAYKSLVGQLPPVDMFSALCEVTKGSSNLWVGFACWGHFVVPCSGRSKKPLVLAWNYTQTGNFFCAFVSYFWIMKCVAASLDEYEICC